MHFRGAVAAEFAKLRTLPAIRICALATVIACAAIAAGLASSGDGTASTAEEAALFAVPFVQASFVLLGVLPMTHEGDGGQLRTSLSAVPGRATFMLAKTTATAALLALTAVVAMGASIAAALVASAWAAGGTPSEGAALDLAALAGAAAYLALIGLFAHATALLLRRFVPALVSVLVLVLLLPPFLSVSEHARWLPSRAGELLYTGSDPVLTAATGALVVAGWIAVVGTAGLAALWLRDA